MSAYATLRTELVYPSLFVVIFCLYAAIVACYRITFHPLSRFPGPILARVSYIYEFWFDVVHKGEFTRKVAELHKIYGILVQPQAINAPF